MDSDGFMSDSCEGGHDCDDTNPTVHPGAVDDPGTALDEDCNGVNAVWCWIDSDGDGVGEGDDPSEGATIEPDGRCPSGRADVGGDCDDADPASFPGAPEVCDDGVDNDCNGADLPCP
jgi:hypothetical protein